MKGIIVSGFGGQGVISLGLMLSYAAMKENLNTSFLPSYGPEMRGGTANCSVVISEKEVASPIIGNPDILVAFNRPSLDKFVPNMAESGIVFADSLCCADYESGGKIISVPVLRLSGENHRGQNIVMLGAVLPLTGLKTESAEAAVREVFKHKPAFIDSNLKCLHAGLEFYNTSIQPLVKG